MFCTFLLLNKLPLTLLSEWNVKNHYCLSPAELGEFNDFSETSLAAVGEASLGKNAKQKKWYQDRGSVS